MEFGSYFLKITFVIQEMRAKIVEIQAQNYQRYTKSNFTNIYAPSPRLLSNWH